MSPGAYNQYLMVLVFLELSLFWIPFNNIHGGGGGLPFGWCGVIAFTQSRRVTSCIHPVLGWPDRYSTTMAIIANTGSNWAVGIRTGYKRMEPHPSTILFCPMMSYGSSVMSCNMAGAGRSQEKVSPLTRLDFFL